MKISWVSLDTELEIYSEIISEMFLTRKELASMPNVAYGLTVARHDVINPIRVA